jgi:2-dehydro-3-deoxyphosphogluconate aldolase / (4S)-4-hydroxy-2-oxoglutarate aldolase
MEMNVFLEILRQHPLVPVIKLDDPAAARIIGKGLMDGGLPVAEVTFRSSFAAEGIRVLRREFPDMLTGAGTVLTRQQADQALEAGAQFIVSPGFNPPVVDHVLSRGGMMIPGVTTPSEIEWAMEKGLELLKFFPAEASGGVAFLKAVAAVYPQVRFMPTGGITSANINEYLSLPHIIACGGSWIVKKVDSDWIAEETRKALNIIRGSRDI